MRTNLKRMFTRRNNRLEALRFGELLRNYTNDIYGTLADTFTAKNDNAETDQLLLKRFK